MANNQLFTILPHYSTLRRLKCQPQLERITNSICKTDFHANVLACRYVINELPDVIAAPLNSSEFVVMSNADINEINKLKKFLTNIHVDFDLEGSVTLSEFEKCLKYTLEFKICSFWSRVGNNLVFGKDFLQGETAKFSAVNVDYIVAGDELLIETNQLIVKKVPVIIDSIVEPNELRNFLSDKNGVLDSDKLKSVSYYVTVIPSLQRARIISIHKNIPKDCPFETYEDLRSHWKNMYGYILPKTPENLLFYKVGFPYWPDKYFIYPSVCVFNSPPQIVYEEKPIVNLHDTLFFNLNQCVKTICGKEFKLTSKGKPNENRFVPVRSILNPKSNPIVPASGKFNFEIFRKGEEEQNGGSVSKPQRSASEIVQTSNNMLVHCSSSLSTQGTSQESTSTKKLTQKLPMVSKNKQTYKSIIPDSPHISKYFSEKKFKIVQLKGWKEGKEIQRDGTPVDKPQNKFLNLSSSNIKPLFQGAEVSRKKK